MMGAMIMLLILIAWDIREQAISPAEAAATQTLTLEEAEEFRTKITWQAEEADWFAERFTLAQQQSEEELADLQARLALAERETQKIKDELERLAQLAQQFDSQTSATPEEVEHLKRLLAQQQQRRTEAELELARLREEAARQEKSYAIVPHRSPDGTFRRPIYIECRGDKIIIQPEGIELVPGDFQTLDRPDNPFNTALRVIRQYYIETGQIVRGSEPYPLLIVRPSGVEMFSNAYQAVALSASQPTGSWVRDYGYEIVCEDWNIQYPEPNEELRHRLLQQLEVSRSRLSDYMIARRRAEQQSGSGDSAPQQFRMDHRGNVTPVGGLRSSEDVQRHFAANRQVMEQQAGEHEANESDTLIQNVANTIIAARAMPEWSPSAELAAANNPEKAANEATFNQQAQQMVQQRQNPAQRPQNWGLQGVTQFATGRYVHIRCEADRFVLPVQAGLQTEREIPIGGSVVTAVDQLVQAIWDFQSSWGSAGENTHWRPILRVRVSSGGEQRLRELQALLRNSGLIIETL